MHICISSDGYPAPDLPYSAFIGVLAEEMVRQGVAVTVIAPQSYTKHLLRGNKLAPRYAEYQVEENQNTQIRVYRPYSLTFGGGRLEKLTLFLNKLVVLWTVCRLRLKPDIFYAHFWTSAYNIYPYAKKKNIPLFVVTGEDVITVQNVIRKKTIKGICDYVHGVICVSSKNKQESIALGLTIENKCCIIPNAINPEEFYLMDRLKMRKELNFPENAFIVAFCGRFNERKGALRLSEAIKSIQGEDIKSIFIGSNVEIEKQKPDCDGILFMGELPHRDIVRYLNCADVFVLPTLAEGCSNSTIEAMACGLPIISSDMLFNYDILDETNAILIDPMNIAEIAGAILTLKNDLQRRERMALCSLEKVKQLRISNRVSRILNFIKWNDE
ncbi:glycosyltransferase family 4 protein [Odoribacter sp. OttesenSCG-928-A06]|nr:glycosyltransferase family 4 protein [Odoribacter sp. OttesenSCG-928-A06]